MMDCNCFVGIWPFHPTIGESLSDLKALHEANGIETGLVSSFQSVFYRDFFLSEEALYKQLKDSSYRQVMTVNPHFPACLDVVRYGIENWEIAGVRIVPGYHGYDLSDETLEPLCQLLEERGLPLFVTMHMEDERSCYLLQSRKQNMEIVRDWLAAHPKLTILFCNINMAEVRSMTKVILEHPAAYFDVSGIRSGLMLWEMLDERLQARMVYGSMSPLNCLKSSLLVWENACMKNL